MVDNLTTTDTDKPLSANQGKVLDNKISEINKSTKEQFATAEGKYIHIEDSVNGNVTEIGVAGKSVQNKYEGKNILKSDITTGSQNGITCTVNSDGTCVLNGTATADTYLNINTDIEVTVGTTYKLVGCPKNDSVSLFARRVTNANSYGEDTGNGVTFVPDENAYVFMRIKSGATLNNVIFRPMLTTDLDATYDDFEPYVGGTPSPNLEYPQSITSVGDGGSITITSCGKNLITYPYSSITKTTNGITYTVKDDGTVIADGTASQSYNAYFNYMYKTLKLSDASYTLSCDGLPKGVYVYVYDETIKSSVANVTNTPSSKTFIGDSTHVYSLSINVSKGITVDNLVFKPQLEIGEKTTEFERYKGSTTTISLSEPLRSIGVVNDEITYQNGKLGVLRRIGKYTIEDMDIQTPGNFGEVNYTYTVNSTINVAMSESPLLCNLFIDRGYLNVRNNDIIGCGCQADGNIIFGLGKDSSIQTIDAFKTWATNNNLVLQFVLKTPTFEELDQSIPYGIVTYKEITNISSSEDTEISVTYPLTDSAASGSKNEAKIVELENEIAELKGKMVTKTVDDVSSTHLDLYHTDVVGGDVVYAIKNGMCMIYMSCLDTSKTGTLLVSETELPSSILDCEWYPVIETEGNNKGKIIGNAYIDMNKLYLELTDAASLAYATLCYVVK